jgi:YD repeat-containing protein
VRALAIILFLLSPTDTAAQQRQLYDAAGRNAGRAVTDPQGSTTFYDAAGNVTARSSVTGNGTITVYDAAGHRIETITRPLSPTRR